MTRIPLPPRRMLTAAAIFLMVSSALVSFFLVQENDRHLAQLKTAEEKTDQAIRTLWDAAANADRDADAAVMVSLLAKDNTPEAAELRRYYFTRTGAPANASATDVLKAAEGARKHAVDSVNDLYLTRLATEDEIMARESSAKRTASIALLLQIMGLVLVILTREMHDI